MQSKAKPIPQSYYDENRERFDAETNSSEISQLGRPCKHDLIIEGTNVECRNCSAGWIGLAKYLKIVNGKIVS